ncbi:hypothetical protein BJX68DRAFT_273078 [Aspergillus pseudodeflectus]|uniref:Xylanolytic transcriptional activator regulatory domain-containing protein n=1 Tax=Aspergillus pseudodeflectus TaxID=176178 RepID=A0ABR4JEE0_9EURO
MREPRRTRHCVYGPHPPAVSRIHQSDLDHKHPRRARSAIQEDIIPIPDPHLNEASAEQDPAIAGAADLVGGENWPDIENIFPSGERTGEEQPSHLPQLLLGLREGTTVKSLLASVPPKAQVGRLVSKYFNSLDLAVWISHPPTFQDQYDRFWGDQNSAMLNWLSILFSIMCLATDLMLHSGQPLPLTDSTGQESVITFRKCSAQCLLLSNYTRPTTHTVDALLLYFYTELVHLHDTDFGLHLVLTMMIRVAMKMDYHRDSSHYPEISIFTGEMRRRAWALLVQLDILVSLQVGLPRMINDRDCDTQAPRNIPAEELHPDMTTLPASRPESGSAPRSYMRARSSLISVLGLIHDQVTSVHPLDYKTVIQLDEMLNAQHKALPQGLQVHKSPRVTDSAAAVMRSLSLDL